MKPEAQECFDWLVARCEEIAQRLEGSRSHVLDVIETGKAFMILFDDESASGFDGTWRVVVAYVIDPEHLYDRLEAEYAARGAKSYIHIRKLYGGPGPFRKRAIGGGSYLGE